MKRSGALLAARYWVVVAGAAAITGGVIGGVMFVRASLTRQQARFEGQLLNSKTRTAAEVTRAVRALKLVTVQIESRVKVERGDESWRGDVLASVDVPVRLHYGTDLSKLEVDRVRLSDVLGTRVGSDGGAYVVSIPRPTRVATEIFGDKERAAVEAGWLRLKSRAGEYYLGMARKEASDAARELELLPQDAEMVERVTREQVAELVKAVAGEGSGVWVRWQ